MVDRKTVESKDELTPELLKERAMAYARQEEKIDVLGELKQFFCFRLGQEWFLVEMSFVSEIVPPARISRIPRGKEFLLGMMNVRGSIVLIADMGRLLRITPTLIKKDLKTIVLKTGGNITGFPVDEVREALWLDTGRMQRNIFTIQGIEAEFIKGLFRHKDKHFVWLDIERVLLEIKK